MGEHQTPDSYDEQRHQGFLRALLDDVKALEQMIEGGQIERGVRRIGAEQEVFLVDEVWRPAPAALDVLKRLDDPRYATELGLFNLEMNLDPLVFGDDCLSRLENQLNGLF